MTSLEDICQSQYQYEYQRRANHHICTTKALPFLYSSTSILQRTFLVYDHDLTIIVPCHPFAQAPNQILDTNEVVCVSTHTHNRDQPETQETTPLLPDKRALSYSIIRL